MSEGQRSESLGIKSGGCVSPCFARELDGKGDKGGEKKKCNLFSSFRIEVNFRG